MQIELENPEEHAIYNIYLELIDVWIDVMEDLLTIEEGKKRIDKIIDKMKDSLKTFPHEEFMLKYFFINGEGWKNYHPFKVSDMDNEDKQKIIGIRTGAIRFFNPDIEYLHLNIKEGSAEEVLQEVINKTRKYANTTPEELKEDYGTLNIMENTLKEMEENLERDRVEQDKEESIMNELLQNEEVKKIYQNIKEDKMKTSKEEKIKETEDDTIKEDTEQKVEEDLKEESESKESKDEKLSLTVKIIIGAVITGLTATAGYFLKEKFLK